MGKHSELKSNVASEIKRAKRNFYKNKVDGLKNAEPGKWHKNIKAITDHKTKAKPVEIPGCGVTVREQANNLCDHFSTICSSLPPLDLNQIPCYLPCEPPPEINPWSSL
jgi:hypothetical protein